MLIEIKKITQKYLPSFVNLWNQDYKLLTSGKWKMNLQKAKEGFEKKMFQYYGAFIKNNLVGFLLLKKDKNTLWIKHLLVDKDFRGKNIGSLLIKKAIILAKDRFQLKTEVLEENKIALNFFLKNGFRILKFEEKEKNYILIWVKKL